MGAQGVGGREQGGPWVGGAGGAASLASFVGRDFYGGAAVQEEDELVVASALTFSPAAVLLLELAAAAASSVVDLRGGPPVVSAVALESSVSFADAVVLPSRGGRLPARALWVRWNSHRDGCAPGSWRVLPSRTPWAP